MDEKNLAGRFEADRGHLRNVAYRMLGSHGEADDAVQEAWLRLSRSGAGGIDNLRGWLTTVVARVCLDMLRSRKSRREEPLAAEDADEPAAEPGDAPDSAIAMADSIGLALIVVLEALGPAERVAFVLHDMFDLPFEEIAPILGRSPDAARQLASRARRRLRGAEAGAPAGRAERQEIVGAFLAASRGGDFAALMALLDPDVVLRADAAAVEASVAARERGVPAPALAAELHGAEVVAQAFAGRARAAVPALVDGNPGLVWAPGGVPRVAFLFAFTEGRIAGIELVMDPARLGELNPVIIGK